MAEMNIVTIAIIILAVLMAALAITFLVGIYSEARTSSEPVNTSALIQEAKGQLSSIEITKIQIPENLVQA